MAEEIQKCKKCGDLMEKENDKCFCEEEVCTNCCECGDDCDCKDKKDDECSCDCGCSCGC